MLGHRFRTAGARDAGALCPPETTRALYDFSGGVPRDILVVAEATMKEAFLQNSDRLLPEHAGKAMRDLDCRRPRLAKAA